MLHLIAKWKIMRNIDLGADETPAFEGLAYWRDLSVELASSYNPYYLIEEAGESDYSKMDQHESSQECPLPKEGSPDELSFRGGELADNGNFSAAAEYFLHSGDAYLCNQQLHEAAECYEELGLLLRRGAELSWDTKQKLSLYVLYPLSRHFFRKARNLYGDSQDGKGRARTYILELDEIRSEARGLEQITYSLLRWTWLYGESPIFILRTAFFILLFLSIGVFGGGINNTDGNLIGGYLQPEKNISTLSGLAEEFGYCLYFSVVTMTTLGYGDLSPATWLTRLIACLGAVIGMLLAAMMVVAIHRRYFER